MGPFAGWIEHVEYFHRHAGRNTTLDRWSPESRLFQSDPCHGLNMVSFGDKYDFVSGIL
jgi:hypothetical protein